MNRKIVGWTGRRTLRGSEDEINGIIYANLDALHVHGAAIGGLDKQVDALLIDAGVDIVRFPPNYRKHYYDKQAPLTRNTKMIEFMLRGLDPELYALWDDLKKGGTWDAIHKWRIMSGKDEIRLTVAGPWK